MDINLICPVNQLGYGVVGYNIFKSLSNKDNVTLFPIGEIRIQAKDEELFRKALASSKLFHSNAPSIRIWHQFEMDMFPGKGKRIGWPIFELDTFTDREKYHLSQLDIIIVCSEWAKDVIRQNNINVPTFVVPLGVDTNLFNFDETRRLNRPYWTKDATVFLNIGKWEKRKGHDELIAAFCASFSPADEVELWMINENPFIGEENDQWKRKYLNTPMASHIKFFPRLESQDQLKTIYSHVDCAVFPSHAEGWNLEALEALACGTHVIATNYSGHTQFLDKTNSYLLDVTGMEKAEDGRWFNGQGNWCSFDMEQLVSLMRDVHNRKTNGTLGININGLQTASKFTWEHSANLIRSICEAN